MTLSGHRPLAKKRGKHELAKAQGCWQRLRDFLIFLVECWIVWCFWHHYIQMYSRKKILRLTLWSIMILLTLSRGWAGFQGELGQSPTKASPSGSVALSPSGCNHWTELLIKAKYLSCSAWRTRGRKTNSSWRQREVHIDLIGWALSTMRVLYGNTDKYGRYISIHCNVRAHM